MQFFASLRYTKQIMAYKCNTPSIEDMLEAGVHFGHQIRRWNPKMQKYIYTADSKTHIIDLYQTQDLLTKACNVLYEIAKTGKQIILVGTKRQASDIVERYAKDAGALYVTQRWLGGTFTNYKSVEGKWKQLKDLKTKRDNNEFSHLTKKERLLIDRQIEKLELFVGGIQDMKKYPGAVVVVDAKREKTAVKEANAVNVPVVAMIDTNTDPDNIDFVIPANDDAIKSIELIVSRLAEAIKAGYSEYKPEKTVQPTKKLEKNAIKSEVKTKEPASEPKVKSTKISKSKEQNKVVKTDGKRKSVKKDTKKVVKPKKGSTDNELEKQDNSKSKTIKVKNEKSSQQVKKEPKPSDSKSDKKSQKSSK